MTTHEQTPPAAAARTRGGGRLRLRRPAPEVLSYAAIATVLAVVLWTRVDDMRGFFLDEWIYVNGGEYMWEHFPGALWGTIPEWTRGPQRLYALLLGVPRTTLSSWTAYEVSHALNVALLVSAVAPAALLARRIIESPPLRVLAVALAVVLPWLTISLHLLTENLAFPVFLWVCYTGVRAADDPTTGSQLAALVAIAVLALCRLNLALAALGPLLAVLVAEIRWRRVHGTEPVGRLLRRRWPFVGGVALGAVMALYFAVAGGGALGAYGGLSPWTALQRLFGDTARDSRATIAFYSRGLVLGGFVLPFALGAGTALAAAVGRLGPRLVAAGLVAIGAGVGVVVLVAAYTVNGGMLEERYVFYAYAPLALFAVAAVEHAGRLRRWAAAGAVLALWLIVVGGRAAADNSGHFFAAPAGAFWSRVMDFRLHHWEEQWLGWTLLAPTGWLLVALVLVVTVAWFGLSRWPRVRRAGLVAALAVCLVGQATMLVYDFKQELHGTVLVPGGLADASRQDGFDDAIPDGATAAIVPGLASPSAPGAGVESLQFWNRDPSLVVSLHSLGLPVPAPPGYGVIYSEFDADGVAHLDQPAPPYLLAQRDDPRLQFAGRVVMRTSTSSYALIRAEPLQTAIWSASGVEGDGAVVRRKPVSLALDRAHARDVRSVVLHLTRSSGIPGPARWTVTRDGRRVASGRVAAGGETDLRLRVPPCTATCDPIRWRLRVNGSAAPVAFPVYGPPGPQRPVVVFVSSARLRR